MVFFKAPPFVWLLLKGEDQCGLPLGLPLVFWRYFGSLLPLMPGMSLKVSTLGSGLERLKLSPGFEVIDRFELCFDEDRVFYRADNFFRWFVRHWGFIEGFTTDSR